MTVTKTKNLIIATALGMLAGSSSAHVDVMARLGRSGSAEVVQAPGVGGRGRMPHHLGAAIRSKFSGFGFLRRPKASRAAMDAFAVRMALAAADAMAADPAVTAAAAFPPTGGQVTPEEKASVEAVRPVSSLAEMEARNSEIERECAHCLEDADDAGKPLRLTACGGCRARICDNCYLQYTERLPTDAEGIRAKAEAQIAEVHLHESAPGSASPVPTLEGAQPTVEDDFEFARRLQAEEFDTQAAIAAAQASFD